MALTPVLPMMAATTLPVGDMWSYEVKWDGYRCMLLSEGTSARLISRNLKDLTADYPHIAAAARSVTREPVILDGELVAVDEREGPSFQALQHRSVKERRWCSRC
jgi:bifunctional non-homologous end joining protein LigD